MSSDYKLGGSMNTSSYTGYVHGGAVNGSETEPSGDLVRPPLLKQSTAMVALFTFAYVLVFVLAVVNNSLVVSAICRNIQLRTTTNYFLANLAIADILVSFMVLPITLLGNLFSGLCQFIFSVCPWVFISVTFRPLKSFTIVIHVVYLIIFNVKSNEILIVMLDVCSYNRRYSDTFTDIGHATRECLKPCLYTL